MVNFNGVGGGTVMYAAHFPRFHPSDFRVRTLDGVADDWPIDYATLEPYFAENDRMMGVSGLAGDPGLSAEQAADAAAAARQVRRAAWQAMNKLGWHWWPSDSADRHRGLRRPRALHQSRPLHSGCAQGAKASTDITYWPAAHPRRRRAAHAVPGARDHARTSTAWRPASCTTTRMAGSSSSRRSRHPRLQRHRYAAAAAEFGVGRFPNGLANSQRPRRQEPDVPPLCPIYGYFDEPTRRQSRAAELPWSKEFYETDLSRGFVRGYTFQFGRGVGPVVEARRRHGEGRCPGARITTAPFAGSTASASAWSAICEDLPEEHNRVTLDPALKDGDGIPAPQDRLHDSARTAAA